MKIRCVLTLGACVGILLSWGCTHRPASPPPEPSPAAPPPQSVYDPERHYIRKGVIKSGFQQDAFLHEWGKPERTYSVTSGAGYAKGRMPMDVWVYEDQSIELAFYEGRLVGWRTIEEARQGRVFRFWTPVH